MDEKIVFSKGSFFHGTKADLAIGDLIVTVSWQGHAPEIRNNMLELSLIHI